MKWKFQENRLNSWNFSLLKIKTTTTQINLLLLTAKYNKLPTDKAEKKLALAQNILLQSRRKGWQWARRTQTSQSETAIRIILQET